MLRIKFYGAFLHSELESSHVSVLIRVYEVQYKYTLTRILGTESSLQTEEKSKHTHTHNHSLSHTDTLFGLGVPVGVAMTQWLLV